MRPTPPANAPPHRQANPHQDPPSPQPPKNRVALPAKPVRPQALNRPGAANRNHPDPPSKSNQRSLSIKVTTFSIPSPEVRLTILRPFSKDCVYINGSGINPSLQTR